MTYQAMIIVINSGKKTKEELLVMCDVFLMNSRITPEEYQDLIDRINAKYPA